MPSARNAQKAKKLYSLKAQGKEILSVEVETVEGLPTPKIPASWVKGLARQRLKKWCQERESHSQPSVPKTDASAELGYPGK